MNKYRVGVNDILWELNGGKPRRLMCDEFMRELYSHAIGVWNENLHTLHGEAIIKRLAKLEGHNAERGISKVARKTSRRRKNV